MYAVAVILSLLLAACGPWTHPTYNVQVDPAYTAEERDVISSALQEWEVETGNLVEFYVRPGTPTHQDPDGIYIAKVADGGVCPDGLNITDFAEGHAVGLEYDAPRISGKVECINPTLRGVRFRTAILHETGHALGLHHVTDVPSVMNPDLNAASTFLTDADYAQFCHMSWRC